MDRRHPPSAVATQEAVNLITSCSIIVREIGPPEPNGIPRLFAIIASEIVGMRGAKLSLHLPHQVRKLRAALDPFDQSGIALKDRTQSTFDKSARRKWSRCNRHASCSICFRSAAGSIRTFSR